MTPSITPRRIGPMLPVLAGVAVGGLAPAFAGGAAFPQFMVVAVLVGLAVGLAVALVGRAIER